MPPLATAKLQADCIGSMQGGGIFAGTGVGRLFFAATTTTVGAAAAATDTPASLTQAAASPATVVAAAISSSFCRSNVAVLSSALGSLRKRKLSATIAAAGAGMPFVSPPRAYAEPALLVPSDAADAHARAVCATAAGSAAADAGAIAAGTCAPLPAQLRAHSDSASESDEVRASKRPHSRCRDRVHAGNAYC